MDRAWTRCGQRSQWSRKTQRVEVQTLTMLPTSIQQDVQDTSDTGASGRWSYKAIAAVIGTKSDSDGEREATAQKCEKPAPGEEQAQKL